MIVIFLAWTWWYVSSAAHAGHLEIGNDDVGAGGQAGAVPGAPLVDGAGVRLGEREHLVPSQGKKPAEQVQDALFVVEDQNPRLTCTHRCLGSCLTGAKLPAATPCLPKTADQP